MTTSAAIEMAGLDAASAVQQGTDVEAMATASMTGRVRVKVTSHLHHTGQGRQRRPGGGGEHRAHRHHRVQGGLPSSGAEQVMDDVTAGHPRGDPDEQEGANTPPEPPIPIVRLHAMIFATASRIRNHSA